MTHRPASTFSLLDPLPRGRLAIEASAGTGKTYVSQRLTRLIPGPVLIPHAIAIDNQDRIGRISSIFQYVTAAGDIGYMANALYPLRQKLDKKHPPWTVQPAEGYDLTGEFIPVPDDIADGPFSLGAGVVGSAVRRKVTTSLHPIRPGYRGICYYRGPAAVSAIIAVPVLERGHLRAVLCADRVVDRPFSPREEELFRESTPHILRAFENERVFMALETSKREQEILYRASQSLSTALTQDAVMEVGLAAAAEIAPHDFAAITEYQPEGRRHIVKRAIGEQGLQLQGLRFRDNTSLTAMVVKNRHYLPYRGDFDSKQQVLFTKKAKLKGMESLLVLPLVVREEPIGTLIVAAKTPAAFSSSVRETLQALGNQLAVSLANARAVRQLEELATTDGLTGCLNKRAFLAELSQKLMAAQRFGRKLSLIVTDLDHFKGVNDTYGHLMGDRVLARVTLGERDAGAQAHKSQGEIKTIIGVIGDRETIYGLELDGLPGVQEVGSWLEANKPKAWRDGIMHGDYHTGRCSGQRVRGRVSTTVGQALVHGLPQHEHQGD